jgi:hypothetical protein
VALSLGEHRRSHGDAWAGHVSHEMEEDGALRSHVRPRRRASDAVRTNRECEKARRRPWTGPPRPVILPLWERMHA